MKISPWRTIRQTVEVGSQDLISILLGLLCILAGIDLWRQYMVNSVEHVHYHYMAGTKHSITNWKFGFHIEDLRIKQFHLMHMLQDMSDFVYSNLGTKSFRQHNRADIIKLRKSRLQLSHLETVTDNKTFTFLNHMNDTDSLINKTNVYQLYCGNKDSAYFRVGYNDFQTYKGESCRIFYEISSLNNNKQDKPHTLFQSVPLSNDGAFGFRSIYNGYFLSAIAAPSVDSYYDRGPWKLVLGGPNAGSAEMFRFTEEGYLYSNLVGGFVQCQDGGIISFTQGSYYSSASAHAIKLKPISYIQLEKALALVSLSSQLIRIYENYTNHHISLNQKVKQKMKINVQETGEETTSNNNSSSSKENTAAMKICIGVPITSKGTDMEKVEESPFWSNFFDSFMTSIDWQANKYIFRIYLGFDKADNLYDTGDAWADIRYEFEKRATFRMNEQLMKVDEINNVLTNILSLRLMHFEDLHGAPSQIVSQLMLHGYEEGFDYFYQVNDDTSIVTSNWAPTFVQTLVSNPVVRNLGVTGPTDSNNEKIFTHSFVHRTHIDIFGHYFPPAFKNWWSDDWISNVYGRYSFRLPTYIINHNLKSQKLRSFNRYEVDNSAAEKLEGELMRGYAKIDSWLRKSNLPRQGLTEVCGYIPSVRFVREALSHPPAPSSAPVIAEQLHSKYAAGNHVKDDDGFKPKSDKDDEEEY